MSLVLGCRLAPSELVAVLSQVGMYQAAIKLCKAHKLKYQPVLECLASACVRLTNMESANRDPTVAWEWLSENDLRGECLLLTKVYHFDYFQLFIQSKNQM